jgi:hypothetical protein
MPYGIVLSDSITDSSGGVLAPSSSVFRNRIINGAMQIDQRNAGAAVTITADGTYTLDRYRAGMTAASKYSVQQVADAPAGFLNSLKVTSLSAYSIGSGDIFSISQYIEGNNVVDLGFGAAGAFTITISFWTKSSLTGTFSVAVTNSAGNYAYPATYTILAANTWEYKTITITGATAGTWLKTNGSGLQVWFSLGTGATYSGTAGAWVAGVGYAATGATSVVGTNGATFYITGVQLEKGSTATSFDYRDYGRELAMCQRYAYVISTTNLGSTPHCGAGLWYTTANALHQIPFPVTMRTAPTFTNTSAVLSLYIPSSQITSTTGSTTGNSISSSSVELYTLSAGTTTAGYATSTRLTSGSFTFSSEL